ncbi:FixH family protein [Ruegeria marina]|uniref:YtkA-like n=1 Tax=Ruegeria marina TaxID=639004 RepID=A0A1G6TE00_9RHOB|nr:FixH family protein [Ruegeria marina]SDD26545.1 YtkA-like [Ruegeria marina]
MSKPVLIAWFLAVTASPALADRMLAEVDCTATETVFAYDCAIHLSQAGAPVEGAEFTVKADMPEMPMAHNLAPVAAVPGGEPGSYTVPLTIEMFGRWMLRLEVNAPRRDVIVLDQEFIPGQGARCDDNTKADHAGHARHTGMTHCN